MDSLTDPHSKAELIDAFKEINQKVTDSFGAIAAERFFQPNSENWSPAENLVHLIKSVSPVGKVIKLPEMLAAGVFGSAQRQSMRFADMRERYLGFVMNGLQTTAPYAPTVPIPSDVEQEKRTLMDKWQEVSARVLQALQDWDEADLDQRTLPHPVLGELTVREMLFFTLIHNLLHANEARVFMGERSLII